MRPSPSPDNSAAETHPRSIRSFVLRQGHMTAAQQRAIDDHPDHQFYNLNIDAGSMWARKLIDRMVAAEAPTPGPRTIPLRPAA